MKKDDQEILKEVQKNTGMAMKAIHTISDKVYDKKMKYELAKEGRKYSELYHKAEDSLMQEQVDGYHENVIEDMMLKSAIHMNTMFNCSTGKIAELMIQGSNRGITSMWKSMNHHPDATATSVEVAKELMDLEEKCIGQLKNFL